MSEYISAEGLKEKLEEEYRSKYKDYIDGKNSMFDVAKILLATDVIAEMLEEKYRE